MNPNHYLAVAVWYLFQNRLEWGGEVAVGKTLVSSSMIDRVAAHLGRSLCEVPVGFKYFVDGLLDGWLGFGGEESAGASFLRKDGSVWTTDKDGFLLDLLAAEILADGVPGSPKVVDREELAPGAGIGQILEWTNQAAGRCEQVAWVGHAPDVGHLTAALIGKPRGWIRFAKGAVAAVRFAGPPAPHQGELRWLVTEKVLGC